MTADEATIRTNSLSVGYLKSSGIQPVLGDINLSASPGRLIALLGANGTGKSTLLRTIAGIQKKLKGDIWLVGKNTDNLSSLEKASLISIVLTERIQAGYLTVGDLVAMGRHPYTDWWGQLDESDRMATMDAIEITGLSPFVRRYLHELSDGQLQKAMIARALAQDGAIMLLDEPLIHLDIPSKWEIMSLLKQMTEKKQKTVILATHELELSLKTAHSIWLIDQKGQIQCGTPDEMIEKGIIGETFNTKHYQFNSRNPGK